MSDLMWLQRVQEWHNAREHRDGGAILGRIREMAHGTYTLAYQQSLAGATDRTVFGLLDRALIEANIEAQNAIPTDSNRVRTKPAEGQGNTRRARGQAGG